MAPPKKTTTNVTVNIRQILADTLADVAEQEDITTLEGLIQALGRDVDSTTVRRGEQTSYRPDEETDNQSNLHREQWKARPVADIPAARWDAANECLIPGEGEVQLMRSSFDGSTKTFKDHFYTQRVLNACFETVPAMNGSNANVVTVYQDAQSCCWWVQPCTSKSTVMARVIVEAPPARWKNPESSSQSFECIIPGVGVAELVGCPVDENGMTVGNCNAWNPLVDENGNPQRVNFYNFCLDQVRRDQNTECRDPGIVSGGCGGSDESIVQPPLPTYVYLSQERGCCVYTGPVCPRQPGRQAPCALTRLHNICDHLTVSLKGVSNMLEDDDGNVVYDDGEIIDPADFSDCGRCTECDRWNNDFELKYFASVEQADQSTCCYTIKQTGTDWQDIRDASALSLANEFTALTEEEAACLPEYDFPCSSAGDISLIEVCLNIFRREDPCCPGGYVCFVIPTMNIVQNGCTLGAFTLSHNFDCTYVPESGDITIHSTEQISQGVDSNNQRVTDCGPNIEATASGCWHLPHSFRDQVTGEYITDQDSNNQPCRNDTPICLGWDNLAAVTGIAVTPPTVIDRCVLTVNSAVNVEVDGPTGGSNTLEITDTNGAELCFTSNVNGIYGWDVSIECFDADDNQIGNTETWSKNPLFAEESSASTAGIHHSFDIKMCRWSVCEPATITLHRCDREPAQLAQTVDATSCICAMAYTMQEEGNIGADEVDWFASNCGCPTNDIGELVPPTDYPT